MFHKTRNRANVLGKFVLLVLIVVIISLIIYTIYLYNNPGLNLHEAIGTGNLSACKDLKDDSKSEICELKLSECNADECFFEKARMESKPSLCYNITNKSLSATCTATIKRSGIYEEAVQNNNLSACTQLESELEIQRCKDNYYIAKRYNENNESYCQKIKNDEIRKECME